MEGISRELKSLSMQALTLMPKMIMGELRLCLPQKWGNKNIIELLLNNGADATIKDNAGQTALNYTREMLGKPFESMYRPIAKMLLEAYIEQRKIPTQEIKEKMLELKKTELREKMKGLPEDVIKYTEQFLRP